MSETRHDVPDDCQRQGQKLGFDTPSSDYSCFVDLPLDIRLFHEKFGFVFPEVPRDLTEEEFQFRFKFLHEELREYGDAVAEGNRANALDSLVDLVVVAIGTAYLHGFPFAEAWRRVMEANMAKVRATDESQSKRGSKLDIVKPEGWTPPNHDDLAD